MATWEPLQSPKADLRAEQCTLYNYVILGTLLGSAFSLALRSIEENFQDERRRNKAMTPTQEAKMETEVSPKVFCADEAHVFLNWIAEGTDGYLYLVPSAPGGWKE